MSSFFVVRRRVPAAYETSACRRWHGSASNSTRSPQISRPLHSIALTAVTTGVSASRLGGRLSGIYGPRAPCGPRLEIELKIACFPLVARRYSEHPLTHVERQRYSGARALHRWRSRIYDGEISLPLPQPLKGQFEGSIS